jgi:hypothetical protein
MHGCSAPESETGHDGNAGCEGPSDWVRGLWLERRLRGIGLKTHVRKVAQTAGTNLETAERFSRLLGMRRIHAYRDDFYNNDGQKLSLLELELKHLQWKNGKVVKQEVGPVRTDDLADAVMYLVSDLARGTEASANREAAAAIHAEFGWNRTYPQARLEQPRQASIDSSSTMSRARSTLRRHSEAARRRGHGYRNPTRGSWNQ